jgi:hypothetical protein
VDQRRRCRPRRSLGASAAFSSSPHRSGLRAMTALLTGLLLGAAIWAVYSEWLVPIFGWGVLGIGLLVLTAIWLVLVVREPVQA